MKKRICMAFVAALMVLSLAACGDKKGNGFNEASPSVSATPTVTGEPENGGTTYEAKTGKDLYHVCGGEIVLASYDKLKKQESAPEKVTDEEVEAEFKSEIEQALADYPNFIPDETRKDTEIKSGDTVNIDYVGKLNGVAFEGGADTAFDLEIGSNTFIADFENGLIGKKVGTTVDVNATFPEDYGNKELAGKQVVFTITINYVGTKKDDADDAYVERISKGQYKSLEEYRAALKRMMQSQKDDAFKSNLYDSVIKDMVSLCEFPKILDEDVVFYMEDMLAWYSSYASYYGMTLEEFGPAMTGLETYDAFKDKCHEDAVGYVKEYMVLQEIVKKENIKLSEEEFNEMLEGYMSGSSVTDKEAFIEEYSREYLEYCMLNDLALDFLIEKAQGK